MSSNPTIGFIGAGNMATALVGGLVANNTSPENIYLSDIAEAQLKALNEKFGVHTSQDNHQLIEKCDIVVLAVKPQVMKQALNELADSFQKHGPLIISIAAGITVDSIQAWTQCELAVIRCMPNTPALVNLGASALYGNKQCTSTHKQHAEAILSAVGIVEWLDDENKIDAVTALSGSGPAYYFLMMEAMITAAEKLGLSQKSASALCIQTALGAAKMAQESDVDITELRKRVTSPKGTTEAALNSFFDANFLDIVENAMNAANTRSIELSKE